MSKYYTIICPLCDNEFEDDINAICDCGFVTSLKNVIVDNDEDKVDEINTHIKCPHCGNWHRKQPSCPWQYWCDCGAEFSDYIEHGVVLTAFFIACEKCGSEYNDFEFDCCECEK